MINAFIMVENACNSAFGFGIPESAGYHMFMIPRMVSGGGQGIVDAFDCYGASNGHGDGSIYGSGGGAGDAVGYGESYTFGMGSQFGHGAHSRECNFDGHTYGYNLF